jgi:hypothetical protein
MGSWWLWGTLRNWIKACKRTWSFHQDFALPCVVSSPQPTRKASKHMSAKTWSCNALVHDRVLREQNISQIRELPSKCYLEYLKCCFITFSQLWPSRTKTPAWQASEQGINMYNIPRDAHIHHEIQLIFLKLQRKLHNSKLKVPQEEWVQKQPYECHSHVRLLPSSWKIPLWNYETLMNGLFWTHIRIFRIYTFAQSSEGRGHLLPLYSVLQFLLNQTNSFKHISDIIDSPFLYLESFPTLELFAVRCKTLHHK